MNVQIKQITVTDPAYRQMLALRDEVLRQPLGMSVYDDDLSREGEEVLIVAESDGRVIGCTMLKLLDAQTLKLRQMAVAADWQGRQIGAKLIAHAERTAAELGVPLITLHARETAAGFYERLGYTVEGPAFTEVGIAHRLMKKRVA